MDPLHALLTPGMKVTIAVDDISLPLPPMARPDIRETVCSIVLEMLADHGVDDIHIIIATSLHRRMTNGEIRRMLGDKVFDAFAPDRLYNHDACDPDGMVEHDDMVRVSENEFAGGVQGGCGVVRLGVEFVAGAHEFQRVRTIRTAKRTTVGQLCEQPDRRRLACAHSFT